MRAASVPRIAGVGINMTPMIDVVFQLIIFFLVSSHLAKQEVHMDLPLPVADSGEATIDELRPRMTINLLSDGRMSTGGRNISGDQLASRLQDALHEHGKNLEVKIRAHRQVIYRHVEPIMLACHRAGIHDVTYSVYRSKDVR